MQNVTPSAKVLTKKQMLKRKEFRLMKQNYMLYLFVLPLLIYVIIFNYIPLYGIQLAFKTFDSSLGIMGSKWEGLKWFDLFFSSPRFVQIMSNTLSISIYSLIAGFPVPIILALMLNCLRVEKFKRFCQTATYLPHFISTVVITGMLSAFFSPRSGFITTMLEPLFDGKRMYFMGQPEFFDHIYVWSGIWQGAGWGSIIYIASLAGVSLELHEAAMIDGATRLRRIWHIDIPAIVPTMVILLILNCGSLMSVGFEKIFLMQNDLNQSASEIVATYTYKLGLQNFQYSFSTAVGLFNNLINVVLLVIVNGTAKKISGSSLW